MKIYIATDHAGFNTKEALVPFLASLGHHVEDCGAHTFDEGDDYTDFVVKVAKAVSEGGSMGIVLGGTGEGEAMIANRFPQVRAAVYYGGVLDVVRLSREHNDANILSLGARFLSLSEAKEAVSVWLETPFSNNERHVRRIDKIDSYAS
ncbi:ribose-5-phosphate isomerase [Candidatus Kaiserbacteria bacterium CG10_big_fil_rev_8_21_14_0_10_49_17]|uniref:Ribose-5-phosphate isomerase n=1 Tax=Candidatus Kaiserbacteria bacterium CG10_big_fil_rev_8_21_14_0_10_49_17 TaxID=1974609 RepID=A0A2M6WF41_9BACT|nr:MAG: ribose-5-phosphate isomerase [Candidatus Kaiserbacteria bacterium CG10_big_fil_rev_8_21_14_0_10_49_17]